MKIAYCIPALYYPSGMERVLTLKANYFAEVFGYEIHIILTDGKGIFSLVVGTHNLHRRYRPCRKDVP